MGVGGSCGDVDCTSVDGLQALFITANHNHRMKGLYRNMFKAWVQEGGMEFASFSHIGFDSKYGSWGVLQHQQDDRGTAWKYQALMENLVGSVSSNNTEMSVAPTAQPMLKLSRKPSMNPSAKPSRRPSAMKTRKSTIRYEIFNNLKLLPNYRIIMSSLVSRNLIDPQQNLVVDIRLSRRIGRL
jgi:hypothetical protein